MIFAFITLIIGLSISCTAAYFSVIGLGQIFAANFWSVVIMGCVIEAGKIAAATWLHTNWYNPLVSKLHKAYLTFAVIIAMFITGLGIFGYLSQSHLNEISPVVEQLTAQQTIEKQIEDIKLDMSNLQKNLDSLAGLSQTKNNNSLDAQRSRLLKQMDKDRAQIEALNKQLLQYKKETSKITLSLGPAKYLADILYGDGTQNVDKAVQIFILLIMCIFDPLALLLILSANFTFRSLKKDIKPLQIPVLQKEIKTNTKEIEHTYNENIAETTNETENNNQTEQKVELAPPTNIANQWFAK